MIVHIAIQYIPNINNFQKSNKQPVKRNQAIIKIEPVYPNSNNEGINWFY